MSSLTGVLRREHELIGRALDVSDEFAQRLERHQPVPAASLSALLQFLSFFAHRSHRDKEEELLFPALREKGVYEGPGCIGVLLAEHEAGAGAFQQMVNMSDAYERGNVEAGVRWAEASRSYAQALRQHMRREEDVLFQNAERLLNDAEQQELAAQFERIDGRAHRAGMDEIFEQFESVAQQAGK
ncbi:MAG: hemerythrin domain-containing protein [Terriglobales bacterium]